MKQLEYKLLFSTIALVAVHTAGSLTNLYLNTSWFDMITHFLGGFWIGTCILWFLPKYLPDLPLTKLIHKNKVLGILISILIIVFLWELFEFALVTIAKVNYGVRLDLQPGILDTLTDIVLGVLGALLSTK